MSSQRENPREVACGAARESPFIYKHIFSCSVTSGASANDVKIPFEFPSMYCPKSTRCNIYQKGEQHNCEEVLWWFPLGKKIFIFLTGNYFCFFFKQLFSSPPTFYFRRRKNPLSKEKKIKQQTLPETDVDLYTEAREQQLGRTTIL